MNDTDGQGSNSLFPANSYDASGEWGRGSGDVRHRFFLFGTYTNPRLWKLTFSPFLTASSAPPFNITTGSDLNLDRVFADRPSFAGVNANCAAPSIRCTRFGNFNLAPLPGEAIIPRNFGRASGSFTANLRITRSFGFGDVHRVSASNQKAGPGTASAAGDKRGPGGPAARGPVIMGGGGGGGERGPGGGGGGMMGGGGGGASAEKKYILTVSLYFQNILNTVNVGNYVGNLSSPQFGQPQSVAGSFGGFGGGGGGSANAGNRRIYMNLRFNF
jgi:hypothetical protein